MTYDRDLVKQAELEMWEKYHLKIEKHGYSLGKNSMMHTPKGISLVATISPNYLEKVGKVFRKIIPMEFEYCGEKIPVILSPSFNL
jgi:hypothetical protein